MFVRRETPKCIFGIRPGFKRFKELIIGKGFHSLHFLTHSLKHIQCTCIAENAISRFQQASPTYLEYDTFMILFVADSRFDLSATSRPALNRHVCSPCLMERTNTTRNRRHCGNVLVKPSVSNNKRFEIKCEKNESLSVLGDMPEDTSSFMLTFKDPCLKQYVTQHCYDQKKVPRIVHYVWFTKHAMDVYSFLSVLSASKFLNPCVIMFHADFLPFGPYWKNLMMNVKNIVFVRRQAPERIFGRRLGYIQHKSDIARIEALTGK